MLTSNATPAVPGAGATACQARHFTPHKHRTAHTSPHVTFAAPPTATACSAKPELCQQATSLRPRLPSPRHRYDDFITMVSPRRQDSHTRPRHCRRQWAGLFSERRAGHANNPGGAPRQLAMRPRHQRLCCKAPFPLCALVEKMSSQKRLARQRGMVHWPAALRQNGQLPRPRASPTVALVRALRRGRRRRKRPDLACRPQLVPVLPMARPARARRHRTFLAATTPKRRAAALIARRRRPPAPVHSRARASGQGRMAGVAAALAAGLTPPGVRGGGLRLGHQVEHGAVGAVDRLHQHAVRVPGRGWVGALAELA